MTTRQREKQVKYRVTDTPIKDKETERNDFLTELLQGKEKRRERTNINRKQMEESQGGREI
jgi:hypothetical protein